MLLENENDEADWAVCIISSREDCDTLLGTIEATIEACKNHKAIIDIIINGNILLRDEFYSIFKSENKNSDFLKIRIWYIELGDKANVFNQYFHLIWPISNLVYFVDGYARPNVDSFDRMAASLQNQQSKLLIAAVPTEGRSAKYLRESMLASGGIHGNLFALTKNAILKIRDKQFFLPLGMYRTDSTIAAAIAFKLDPKINKWDLRSVSNVVLEASWSLAIKRQTLFTKVSNKLKQLVRQGQGRLENLAVKECFSVNKKNVNELPENVF